MVDIYNFRWLIDFRPAYDEYAIPLASRGKPGSRLFFEPARKLDLTTPIYGNSATRIKFFGQPIFNNKYGLAIKDNKAAIYLFTYTPGWGVSGDGNHNIFIGLDAGYQPSFAFEEASC